MKQNNEEEDKEYLMAELWDLYLKSGDVEYLAKAADKAPFFGQKEMSKEIGKILRSKR